MSSSAEWLIDSLVQKVPSLRIIYEEHVADNGEVLPHVLFWDFTRHTVESYISDKEPADWIQVLDFLEDAFGIVDDYSRGVISASFLESLPYAGEPGAGIAEHLGPTLRSRLAELRRKANLFGRNPMVEFRTRS